MALHHKLDVKNDFAYVLQFFSLISDSLGSVGSVPLPARGRQPAASMGRPRINEHHLH